MLNFLEYLNEFDLQYWQADSNRLNQQKFNSLESSVKNCTKCALSTTRNQAVFGRGSLQPKVMIIGEAPGFHEDSKGLPFVGKAGILLTNMLNVINLTEKEYYIANVIKCRPPANRDPLLEEVNACQDYLTQQITLLKPELILGLGKFAGHFLTKTTSSLSKLRNKLFYYQNIPTFITYHPAYLLRNPKDKKLAFTDFLKLKCILN